MATIGNKSVTLLDWAKRKDPDGKTADIVEMLSQTNEMIDDMLFMEGNLETGHRTTIRTGLPTPAWRRINKGVQPSKSTTAQVDEACGRLESISTVDEALAELEPDLAAFRLSEAQAFLEAMTQEACETMLYGNSTNNKEEIAGLMTRYSDLSAPSGKNIIDGGGTGSDNTSFLLTVYGDNTVCGIFPKGTKAGLEHKDKQLQQHTEADGSILYKWTDQWVWRLGIALKDWRYVVRGANIDVSSLTPDASGGAKVAEMMIKAMHLVPNLKSGKACFNMNRTLFTFLDLQRFNKGNAYFKEETIDGMVKYTFRGIPVKINDAILDSEARVV